jgi:hypothetical protein
MDAACKGNTVTIKKLIAAGSDPNYRNAQTNTMSRPVMRGAAVIQATVGQVNGRPTR